jgi:hypothetical protein
VDKKRAGLESRVVQLFSAAIVAEVLRVFRCQERALVMIEPPRQARIAGVFKIDDRVFVAVKQAGLKKLEALWAIPVNRNSASG